MHSKMHFTVCNDKLSDKLSLMHRQFGLEKTNTWLIDTYNKRQGGYDVTTALRRRISGTTIARRTKFGHGLLHI